YRTASDVQGRLIISPRSDQRVSTLTISLTGETISNLVGRGIKSITIHRFLKLDMLAPEILELISEPLKNGHVYEISFHFIIPDQLPSTACTHNIDVWQVKEHHLRLPPSLGVWKKDDMSPGAVQIEYAISIFLSTSSSTRLSSPRDLTVKKTINVVTRSIKSPPIYISPTSQRYVLSATKVLRESFFRQSLGTISATVMKLEPLHLHPYEKALASTHINVGLTFDPARSGITPPQSNAMSLTIRSYTWHHADPSPVLPDSDDRPSLRTPFRFYVKVPVPKQFSAQIDWSEYADNSLKSPSFYSSTLRISLLIPTTNKIILPTFHPCFISRTYDIRLCFSFKQHELIVITPVEIISMI
ncbi:hypothetical protein DER44DRAFT_678171, partial [Fusarium oxysporum]